MSSTSQKHRNFVAEPMGEKPVTDLAGVGEVLGKRLETAGFDKVLFLCVPVMFYVVYDLFRPRPRDRQIVSIMTSLYFTNEHMKWQSVSLASTDL